MSLSPPGVHLYYDPQWQDSRAINELCWGLEEQGVPCLTTCVEAGGDARTLSHLAAKGSALRVGLGLSASGEIALTHAQLPATRPLMTCSAREGAARLRALGVNAGQLVKVLPFSDVT